MTTIVKVSPTAKQVRTFEFAIELYRTSDATITASMDEDGTMLIHVLDDGLTTHARFDTGGQIIGDWF
jgi:hypothetical protein